MKYLLALVLLGAIAWRYQHPLPTLIVVIPRSGDGIHASPPTTLASRRESWAREFLARLGNTTPTEDTVTFVVAWQEAENTDAAHNPLATTQPMPNNGCFSRHANGQCYVRDYPDHATGMEATIITLTNGFYPHILYGLQWNLPEEALNNEELGTWGTGLGAVKRLWKRGDASQSLPEGVDMVSSPISGDSSAFGVNVRAALNARNGALKHIVIWPGDTWSFNATIGDPAYLALETIIHPGDGWCNLAARYAQVGRAAGLTASFQDHGVGDLGGGAENSVSIWNVGGIPGTADGRQDLELTNITDHIITLDAIEQGDQVIIVATIG